MIESRSRAFFLTIAFRGSSNDSTYCVVFFLTEYSYFELFSFVFLAANTDVLLHSGGELTRWASSLTITLNRAAER